MGLPYQPKWGKGTKGFKVSNIWIGSEYFEFVRIKTVDGGGWRKEWTKKYLEGHRGLIGFALEVENIDETYQNLTANHIHVSPPKPLQFRWFFNLFTKTMPWRNSFLPEFKGVPFQFFLQQLNDEKSKKYMEKFMVPNSRDNGINGIEKVIIYGNLTNEDKKLIYALFPDYDEQEELITINLGKQTIQFITSNSYRVEVVLNCSNPDFAQKKITIGNLQIRNA